MAVDYPIFRDDFVLLSAPVTVDISEQADGDSIIEASWSEPILAEYVKLQFSEQSGSIAQGGTTGFRIYCKYTPGGDWVRVPSVLVTNQTAPLDGADELTLTVLNTTAPPAVAALPGAIGDQDDSTIEQSSAWSSVSATVIYGVKVEWFEGASETGTRTMQLNAFVVRR